MKQKKRFPPQDVGAEKCELFDNSALSPWLFLFSVICCVAAKEAAHMNDYMQALHARFCREPELQKAQEELEQAYREIKARLVQEDLE